MDDSKDTIEQKDKEGLVGMMLILHLLQLSNENASIIWQDFEDEITNQNRFFPNSVHILEAIDVYAEKAIYKLKPNQTVYRARIIKPFELSKDTKDILAEITRDIDPYKDNELYKKFEKKRYANYTQLLVTLYKNKDILNRIDKALLTKIKQSDFWGFSSEKSDAPSKDKATAGRANPKGVPYLYAAEDPKTAIIEARPIIGQIVSVAEIEVKKEIKLFDFCNIDEIMIDDETKTKAWSILSVIENHFSTPNHNGECGYYSTQYICDRLKTKYNFEGIRFRSSLDKNGINIVVFDNIVSSNEATENYNIKYSSLHYVDDINFVVGKVLPV